MAIFLGNLLHIHRVLSLLGRSWKFSLGVASSLIFEGHTELFYQEPSNDKENEKSNKILNLLRN